MKSILDLFRHNKPTTNGKSIGIVNNSQSKCTAESSAAQTIVNNAFVIDDRRISSNLIRTLNIILVAIMFISCIKQPAENNSTNIVPAHICAPIMQIDTTINLIVFKPNFNKVELEVGSMPSQENDSVLFCAAAAFTSQLKTDFSQDNIVGAYITHGQYYLGDGGGKNYGRFVYANKQWRFIDHTNHAAFDKVANDSGCAFSQMWVIQDHQIYRPYARKDSTQQNIYRCLCERNDTLMVAQCRKVVPYHIFVKALQSYGINNAIYMDMGSGWNHSFYRDNDDSLHVIFPHTHNYCTNWITFYK